MDADDGLLHPITPVPESAPVLVKDIIHHVSRTWDTSQINRFLPTTDIRSLVVTCIGDRNDPDRLIWPHTRNGAYSVKSGYNLSYIPRARELVLCRGKSQSSHQAGTDYWKMLWSIKSLPKIKLFLWRVSTNCLPTMIALFNRRVVQNPLCPLCKEFPELTEHVLFLCPWTIGVWFASSLNYRLDRSSITTFDEWWSALKRTVAVNTDSQSWVYTVASFICWEIWKSRCNCIFHGSVPSPEYTAEKASQAAAEFFKSGLGVVFRSSNGTLINGVSTPCLSSSTLQTEAKAALLAVRSAKDSNFSNVVFESDSLELIRSLKNDFKKANWTIFPLLIQIRNLSSQFRSLNWRWVPRQVNSATDWVASHCKRRMCSDVWVIRPPSSLVHILSKDGLPCPP
ncbi:hypothetical protein ACFX1R_006637 [Malus domestica]